MGIPLLVGTCKKKRYTKVNPDSGVLNTTKYLDYINWKEAFLLYFSLKTDNISLHAKTKIFNLQSCMNDNRTNFDYPQDHNVKITPPYYTKI